MLTSTRRTPDGSELPTDWRAPDPDLGGTLASRALRALRRRTLSRFFTDLQQPREAQVSALERVLDASLGTHFAREVGLDRVRTLADYRSAIPITPAAEHEVWLRRAVEGGPGVLTRHPHLAFNRTSGTTGRPKDLPVTAPWAHAVSEAQAVWVAAMLAEHPDLARFGARALTTVGRREEARSPGGVVIGSNTGRMHAAQPWWVKLRYAVPAEVFAIPDPEVRTYVLLRLALAVDVRSWTTANPSSILMICRLAVRWRESLARDLHDGTVAAGPAADLPSRLRRRLAPWAWRRRRLPADPRPAAYWPNLRTVNCWKGGASPFFVERIPEALGARVPIREVGVSASEGHLAIPLHSSWWGGVLHVGGHLIELLPEGGGEVVLPHEATIGEVYRPILSTTAGLYRYDLGDRIVVEGRYRRTPVVRFLGKVVDVVSLVGEKLHVDQLAEAARRVLSPAVIGWSTCGRLSEVPVLELLVDGPVTEGDAEAFDHVLVDLNGEYASKRSSGRHGGVRVRALPAGSLERWRRSRAAEGAADGQIKDPCVVAGPLADRLLAGWRD